MYPLLEEGVEIQISGWEPPTLSLLQGCRQTEASYLWDASQAAHRHKGWAAPGQAHALGSLSTTGLGQQFGGITLNLITRIC